MKEQHNSPWIINGEKNIYENPWIRLTEYDVINPSGGKGIYGKVHFKNTAVGVVALDEEKNIVLVGQYRFPLNEYSWEIPEGGSSPEDDPLTGCKRELLEETGIKAAKWKLILTLHLSNSVTDELAYIYLATGLTQHQPEPEETEQLAVKTVPFAEACNMVHRGEITDAMSVAAIIKTQLLLLEGKLK